MKTVTVRSPWAGHILLGGKDVENRTWQTHHRGPLLIHCASARVDHDAPLGPTTVRGAIVGVVNVVDCVRGYESDWALNGFWHWVLREPEMFARPVECSGQLMLWEPPQAAWRLIAPQLS